MQFQSFKPEYHSEVRKEFYQVLRKIRERGAKPRKPLTDEDIAMSQQIQAEERFVRAKRPYYRIYPGVLAALLQMNLDKIDISAVQPPLPELSLEFFKEYPLRTVDRTISSVMFARCGNDEIEDSLFVEHCIEGGQPGIMLFPRRHGFLPDYLDTMDEPVRATSEAILKVVFGVCMISQSDSVLIQPRVLAHDQEKYRETGDQKYIEKARRRGVIGWDIGRDIPTPEEMEAMRGKGEKGRMSPHWRTGHLAVYHTGEGRKIPIVRWIDDIFVNKDLYEQVPHGYHGSETGND